MSEIFHTFRDGEEVDYFHPIATYVQGSLAEERRSSTGRYSKDIKSFKKMRRISNISKIDLVSLLNCDYGLISKRETKGQTPSEILENRLSYLGATYPETPGLGINITGLRILEGKNQGKKIFDLLHYLNQGLPEYSWERYLILEKFMKILGNSNQPGDYWLNSKILLGLMSNKNLAEIFVEQVFSENKSAIQDSIVNGYNLAHKIFISFISNLRMYDPKVRKKGYGRSSPIDVHKSKDQTVRVNSSWEALYYKNPETILIEEEGKIVIRDKSNIEQEIFEIFKNSARIFKNYQEEILAEQQRKEFLQSLPEQAKEVRKRKRKSNSRGKEELKQE